MLAYETKQVGKILLQTTKKKTGDKDTTTQIGEKLTYVPHIILGTLIVVFLLLIIHRTKTKDKTAKKLEKYRKKINILRKTV